jgi:hypothetical protein
MARQRRGKIFRQGQQNWDAFVEAGIVENDVFFDDDPIVTAHAIGKTKDTIGYCWPMDAAVAYTLASAGPNAALTSKEMVNQYTRMAAVMMSQTVGYGSITDPRLESCGHDEIDGYNIEMNDIYCEEGVIKISSKTNRPDGLKAKMSDEMRDLMSFRVTKRWARKNIIESARSNKYMSILLTERMKPIKQFAEEHFGTDKWESQTMSHTRYFKIAHTFGECAWADDPEKRCAHHSPESYHGWAMVRKEEEGEIVPNRFVKIWNRGKGVHPVYSKWNNDMFSERGLDDCTPNRVILWDRVKRGLAHTVDEKVVIKGINAACRRMTARNFNVIRKEGVRNKATYTWKEWDWLHHLKAWIAQTSKKNRKEHDLVNGWKWTKYGSRMSYGYEIANFKWVPGKENDNYDETMDKSEQWVDGKVVITYANHPAVIDEFNVYKIRSGNRYYGGKFLPWTWKTKEETQQYIDFQSMLASRTNAVNSDTRSWDASTGQELLCPIELLSIERQNVVGKIEMDMSQMPEELPSSREVFEALMWGNPQEFDAAYALLNDDSKKHWDRPTIENEIEESEGEEVAIAA